MQGAALPITRQLLALVDEFLPTIDPHDGKYEVRMQGLKQMKNGMATQLDGAVLSMKETGIYSDAERGIIAKHLAADAPAILERLDPSVRREFEIKVKELRSSEKNPEIKELLASLLKQIAEEGSNKPTGGDAQ